MDIEAESAPLVSGRPDASKPAAARSVRFDVAPAQASVAAGPGARAVFELEEDESAAVVRSDEPRAAAEPRVVNSAAAQESMPIWVIPLLAAAVGGSSLQLGCCTQRQQ